MNKKYLLTTSLAVALILSGCGKGKKSATPLEVDKEKPTQSESVRQTTTSFEQEIIDNLIENSDYISKVRIQAGSNSGINYNFIHDYRGDLSNLEMTLPKSLNPNRDYIVFYRDGEDGTLTPTRGDESFIEIQDDRDQSLQYIEDKFPLPESINPQMPADKKENLPTKSKKDTIYKEDQKKKSDSSSSKKNSNVKKTEKTSDNKKPTTDLKKK
ncbi:MAG: hypothetical protein Q4P25_02640 [Tissierellia bacterium]|nr:hypothetical protein [Tissierellia bacterium]